MAAKDVHAMNAATQELADLNAARQNLAENIAKYRASAGIEPVDTAPAAPQPAKARPPECHTMSTALEATTDS